MVQAKLVSGLVGLSLVTLGAMATAVDKPAATRGDPNEKICEKVDMIGTRLGSKRICATRAEWAERRRQEKEVVDDTQRRVNVGCSTVGTHSGAPTC